MNMEDKQLAKISKVLNMLPKSPIVSDKSNENPSESSSKEPQDNPPLADPSKDPPVSLHFKCELCNLNETCNYFGKSPPWSTKTILLENAYVMKDPFSLPQKRQVLILGAKCSMCESDVCVSPKCSLFFSKRFCKDCAFKNMTYFPTQVQIKINKNFAH